MPYPMRAGPDVPGRTVRFDPSARDDVRGPAPGEGRRYTVTTSIVPARPSDELRAAGHATSIDNGIYIEPPRTCRTSSTSTRAGLDRGRDTDFDKAMAIQDHLRDTTQFRYDVNTSLTSGTRSIVEFLTKTKAGFCQQFSTAMAVMLRRSGSSRAWWSGSRPARGRGPTDRSRSRADRRTAGWRSTSRAGDGCRSSPRPTAWNPVTSGYESARIRPVAGCVDDRGLPPAEVQTSGDRATAIGPTRGGSSLGRRAHHRGRPGAPAADPEPEGPSSTARIALLVGAPRGRRRCSWSRRGARCAGGCGSPGGGEPRRLILVTYDVFVERAAGLGLGRATGRRSRSTGAR